MYSEADLLPLSGLQHMAFCERRWALVQIELVWADNQFTAEGKVLHEKAHSGDVESRPGVLISRTLPVRSFRLGISGQADIVEFHPVTSDQNGAPIKRRRGLWRPYPVEYKRSRDKGGSSAYQVQLCAQALCLEEMLSTGVPEGAVYDGTTKRRQIIPFDAALRNEVQELAFHMHDLFSHGVTPAPVLKKACKSCSLVELCKPDALTRNPSVEAYFMRAIKQSQEPS